MQLTPEQAEQYAQMFAWLCDSWKRNDSVQTQALFWNSSNKKQFIKRIQDAMKAEK